MSSTQAACTDCTKHEVRIYDYVDSEVGALARMFEKRMKAYRAIGYSVVDHRKVEPEFDAASERSEDAEE